MFCLQTQSKPTLFFLSELLFWFIILSLFLWLLLRDSLAFSSFSVDFFFLLWIPHLTGSSLRILVYIDLTKWTSSSRMSLVLNITSFLFCYLFWFAECDEHRVLLTSLLSAKEYVVIYLILISCLRWFFIKIFQLMIHDEKRYSL